MNNLVDPIVISKHVLEFTKTYINAEGDNCSSIWGLFQVRETNLPGYNKVSQEFKNMLAALKRYGNKNIIEDTQRSVFYTGVYKVLFSQFHDKCRMEGEPQLTEVNIKSFDKAFVTYGTVFSKDAEFALKAVMGEFKNANDEFEGALYKAALGKFKEYRDRIMEKVVTSVVANQSSLKKNTIPPRQSSTINSTKNNATSNKTTPSEVITLYNNGRNAQITKMDWVLSYTDHYDCDAVRRLFTARPTHRDKSRVFKVSLAFTKFVNRLNMFLNKIPNTEKSSYSTAIYQALLSKLNDDKCTTPYEFDTLQRFNRALISSYTFGSKKVHLTAIKSLIRGFDSNEDFFNNKLAEWKKTYDSTPEAEPKKPLSSTTTDVSPVVSTTAVGGPSSPTPDEIKCEFQREWKTEIINQIKTILIASDPNVEPVFDKLFKSIVEHAYHSFFTELRFYAKILANLDLNTEFDEMPATDKTYVFSVIKPVFNHPKITDLRLYKVAVVNDAFNATDVYKSSKFIKLFFDYLISRREESTATNKTTAAFFKNECTQSVTTLFLFEDKNPNVNDRAFYACKRALINNKSVETFQLMLNNDAIIKCLTNTKLPAKTLDLDKIIRSAEICKNVTNMLENLSKSDYNMALQIFDKPEHTNNITVNGVIMFPKKEVDSLQDAMTRNAGKLVLAIKESQAALTANDAADNAIEVAKELLKNVLLMISNANPTVLTVLANNQYVDDSSTHSVIINAKSDGYTYTKTVGLRDENQTVTFSDLATTTIPPSLDNLLNYLEIDDNVKIFCAAINYAFDKIKSPVVNDTLDKMAHNFFNEVRSPNIVFSGGKRRTLKNRPKKSAKRFRPIRQKSHRMNKKRSMKR